MAGDVRGLTLGTGLSVFLLGQGPFVAPPAVIYTPIPHVTEQIMFGLFLREATYAAAPSWATAGCRMTDYDDNSAHAIWDDLVEDDTLLSHNHEHRTQQEIVRQSVRLPYVEPRAHPNSLGGLLTLALGQRITAQDGALDAYRHALTLVGGNVSLSMAAQVHTPPGQQYLYTGLKADSFLLRSNGAFLTMACDMVGSGYRALAAEAFPPSIEDPWLRWGDCHIWLKDVTSAPLSVPGVPVQGTTNLGVGAVDISLRIVRLEYVQPCHLWADGGYRPSSGMLRDSLFPARREAGIRLELDADSDDEAALISHYLEQHGLAFEWQCAGQVIASGGTYRYGFTLILPRLQWRRVTFENEDAVETLAFEGVVMEDTVNPGVQAWVYTNQPQYLALEQAILGCQGIVETPGLDVALLYCWDLDEVSGTRVDHIQGEILTEVNGAVGSEPGLIGLAATFQSFPAQRVLQAPSPAFFFQPPFTVAFLTKLTVYPTAENATFIGNGASQNAGQYEAFINMGVFSHLIGMATRNGADSVTHPAIISLNEWHCVICWHTGTQTGIQIDNGTIALSTAISNAPSFFTLTVGGMGSGTYGLGGAMDVVIVWTRALTDQAERTAVWQALGSVG